MTGAPKIQLLRLFERTSARGNRYLTGRLGSAKLIASQATDVPEDQRYGADVVWNVFIQGEDDQHADRPNFRGDRARRHPTPAETSRVIEAVKRPASWIDDSKAAIDDLTGRGP
jgi:hypothetical protein